MLSIIRIQTCIISLYDWRIHTIINGFLYNENMYDEERESGLVLRWILCCKGVPESVSMSCALLRTFRMLNVLSAPLAEIPVVILQST